MRIALFSVKLPATCLLTLSLCNLTHAQESDYETLHDKNPLKISSPSLKNGQSKKIRLANGLEAYLISDPDTKQCAAGLSVEVGSFYDPAEYPGMAHYVEHAVFMGSEKYPDENAFFECVQDNQGLANAYTKSDLTVYMFSCNPSGFHESLDRFSRFFIDPLFRKDALARELNAVDNEHRKNIKNDDWRCWQVYKETASEGHPVTKFSTGTKQTLEIIPRNLLVDWYRRNYSADRMHLVVYTNESLEKTAAKVSTLFSGVPVSENRDNLPYQKMSSTQQEGHITYITPIKDLRRMIVSWELPQQTSGDFESKSAELIAYTLSYKGEHSLVEELKKEGLVNRIDYDVDTLSKEHRVLSFYFSLTKKGTKQSDLVLYRFYQALNQLKRTGIPTHIYHEMIKTAKNAYEWQQRENPFYIVREYADAMAYEPIESFPYQSITVASFQPKRIRFMLQHLSPSNCMVTIQAPTELTKQKPDRKEHWMGVEYSLVKIDAEKLTLWDEAPSSPKISIAPSNPFIPSNLSLVRNIPSERPDKPVLLAKEPSGTCYFMLDSYYLCPEVNLLLSIKAPAITDSARSKVLADLYTYCLQKKLASLTGVAARAGISTSIAFDEMKIKFDISGYSDKIDVYTSTLLDRVKKLSVKESDFTDAKEALASHYTNQTRELPFFQGIIYSRGLLYSDCYPADALSKEIQQVRFDDFVSFKNEVRSNNFLELTIGGNLTAERAKKLWQTCKASLSPKAPLSQSLAERTLTVLSQESGAPYKVHYHTPLIGNAVILTLQVGKETPEKLACMEILSSALKEAFFTELRTNQQIAYIATTQTKEALGELMITLALHSATHSTSEILARFDLFLENYVKNFHKEISPDRFEAIKQSVLYTFRTPPENLDKHLASMNQLAFSYNADFDRKEKMISAIESLSYDNFESYVKQCLDRSNTRRLAVLVNGMNGNGKKAYYQRIAPEAFIGKTHDALPVQTQD